MGAMGRPLRGKPADFADTFIQHGWESADVLRTNAKRIARWLDEEGREDLKRRRRNYVMGRRLSSLKVGSASR